MSALHSSSLTISSRSNDLFGAFNNEFQEAQTATQTKLDKQYRGKSGKKIPVFEIDPDLLKHITSTITNPTIRETLMPDPLSGSKFKLTPATDPKGTQFGTYLCVDNRFFLINTIAKIGNGNMKLGGVQVGVEIETGNTVTFSENEFESVVRDIKIEKKLTSSRRKTEKKIISFLCKLDYMNENNQKMQIIISEYMNCGDLEIYVTKIQKLSFKQKLKIVRDILEGLKFIHSKNIIHRDIKPANIFLKKTLKKNTPPLRADSSLSNQASSSLSENSTSMAATSTKTIKKYTAKIGDLGLALEQKHTKQGIALAGTPDYWPPEMWALVEMYNVNNNALEDYERGCAKHKENLSEKTEDQIIAERTVLKKQERLIKKLRKNLIKHSKKSITAKMDIFSLGKTIESVYLYRITDANKNKEPSSLLEIAYWDNLTREMKNKDPTKRPNATKLLELINNKINELRLEEQMSTASSSTSKNGSSRK